MKRLNKQPPLPAESESPFTLSGIFGFETSPSHFSFIELLQEFRKRTVKAHGFHYIGVGVLGFALVFSVVSTRSTSTMTSAAAATPAKAVGAALVLTTPVTQAPQIGSAEVINHPSDGTNGTPLAYAAGRPLFPLPDNDVLSYNIGDPIIAEGVQVQSVVDDTGFWVGANVNERVFIHVVVPLSTNKLPAGVLSPASLHQGELVDLTGHFQLTPSDPSPFGVAGADLQQIVGETEYVVADSINLPGPVS